MESLGGRYITAEDVGTSSRDMRVIAERTEHVAGLPRRLGGSGDPSPFTALGVESAIRACCERVFASSVAARPERGGDRARSRRARGSPSDAPAPAPGWWSATSMSRKRRLAEELGADWASPERALEADVDVVAPCALGGILDHETVPRLRCRIVAGAANNQLADESVADLLAARDILWAPDFVANAGGIINIAEELDGYDAAAARRRVRRIGEITARDLRRAEAGAVTPLTAAMDLARARLAA